MSSSSPDPLSFVTSSPTKSAATRRSAKRATQPLLKLSSNVQRSDPFLEIPDLGAGSPSKSITMTTPRAAGSSPWRIKVTVEAQPHNGFSQDENSLSSPTGARSTRFATKTTTIPLNDADGPSPVKRRGRPRKSDTVSTSTISPNETNGASPTKKRGRPRKPETAPTTASQTTTIPLNDAAGSSPVNRRGKNMTTPVPGRTRNGTPVRKPRKSITRSPDDSELDSSLNDASYHPNKRAPARPRRSMSKDINAPEPIRADAMYGPRSPAQLDDKPCRSTADATGSTRASIGQRRRSMRGNFQHGDIASDTVEEEIEHDERTPKASPENATRDEDMWKSMVSHHEYESDETAEDDVAFSDDELDIVVPDQTIGETTMLHSEEFSMVSLDSLPSMRAALNVKSPDDAPTRAGELPYFRTDPIPPTRRQRFYRQVISSPLPKINDSVASVSFMPSSPPIIFAAQTPPRRRRNESPSVPPAIQQAEISPSKAETPKLVNVVKAGIALQGVVNGNNRGTQDRRPSDDIREEAQRARLDGMFNEFESGTRRELQAGLRLGEQLAQRARSRATTRESSRGPSRDASVERPVTRDSNATTDGEVFDGPSAAGSSNRDSSHHRLPTPEEKDYSLPSPPPAPSQLLTQQPDLPVKAAQAQLISPARSQASPDAEEMQDEQNAPPSAEEESGDKSQSYQDSVLQQEPGEDFEVYWQRRRETISRKIDEADSSQVIVLSSDHDETSEATAEPSGDALGSDIWEEEGSRSSDTQPAGRRTRRGITKRFEDKPGELAGTSTSERSNLNRSSQGSSLPNDRRRNPINESASSLTGQNRQSDGGGTSSRNGRSSSDGSSDGALTPASASEVESTENTGMFWQRSSESPQPEPIHSNSNKLDLSVLMAMDDSPAKEFKDPPLATPPKLQPSRAPYNLGNGIHSPAKGSPLKQQILFSSPSAVNSSPYNRIQHTIASSILQDGDTMVLDEDNTTSHARPSRDHIPLRHLSGRTRVIPPSPAVFAEEDLMIQRQIENELTPRSARLKSVDTSGDRRRLFDAGGSRTETAPSEQVDSYSRFSIRPSERSAEKSSYLSSQRSQCSVGRSSFLVKQSSQGLASQSRNGQNEDTHMQDHSIEPSSQENRSNVTALNLNKHREPLFEPSKPIGHVSAPVPRPKSHVVSQVSPEAASEPHDHQAGGFFGKLWGAFGVGSGSATPQAPQVQLHPLAARYKHLPKIAPWTKTHWDTLDRIYQRCKRHPDEFSPKDPLHQALLAQKYQWQPENPKMQPVSYYTDVEMQKWNYTVKMTPQLLVCCAIFMQLLTLKDAAEYRCVTGKDIVRGNFMQKDKTGDPITLRDVIARLFGVVGGEMIRADEKRGICIRRDLDQFKLKYPWAPGWWDEMGQFLHD